MPAGIAGLIEDFYAGVLDPVTWQRALGRLARECGAERLVIARYHADTLELAGLDAEPAEHAGIAPQRLPGPDDGAARKGYSLGRIAEWSVMLWLPDAVPPALRLDWLQPGAVAITHLLRALELRLRLAAVLQHSEALAASVARMNLALLATDASGIVLARSALAARLLESASGIVVDPAGRLCIEASGERLVVAGRKGGPRAGDRLLRIPRSGRAPLSVLLWPQREPVAWIVMLCDPEQPLRVDLRLIAAELGLSVREAQVAIELCTGRTQGQIAEQLRISINTVRTHVKSIYGKVGARSQVALIRRIALSPASLLRVD